MALSFARIWPRKGIDIVEQFFQMASDAELHRDEEHSAAIIIQKAWRGFVVRSRLENLNTAATTIQRYHRGYRGRELLERLIVARDTERRMSYYFDMAVQVQRIWRGYRTRAHVFDYYKRKAYIEGVKQKMESLREHLAQHLVEQEQQQQAYLASLAAQKADRLAGTRHHLLGTKDVPGIYSGEVGQRRTVNVTVEREHGSVNDLLDQTKQPSHQRASPRSSGGTYTAMIPPLRKIHEKILLPPLYIPEPSLKHSTALKEWVRDHVGVRNYKGPPLQMQWQGEEADPDVDGDSKRSQGPFLIERELSRVLSKPLQPTLRVETGFLDTKQAQLEERRLREGFRVADQIFKVVPRVKHPHPPYYPEPIAASSLKSSNAGSKRQMTT
ncbi:hypothetical protein DFJ77DRAFT_313631 [Powellomyces hirtus]|nr:hypothetical protein DFJ77DRAFT_313631 [Powellomyces hirtus]